jgi:hypothetical protein
MAVRRLSLGVTTIYFVDDSAEPHDKIRQGASSRNRFPFHGKEPSVQSWDCIVMQLDSLAHVAGFARIIKTYSFRSSTSTDRCNQCTCRRPREHTSSRAVYQHPNPGPYERTFGQLLDASCVSLRRTECKNDSSGQRHASIPLRSPPACMHVNPLPSHHSFAT